MRFYSAFLPSFPSECHSQVNDVYPRPCTTVRASFDMSSCDRAPRSMRHAFWVSSLLALYNSRCLVDCDGFPVLFPEAWAGLSGLPMYLFTMSHFRRPNEIPDPPFFLSFFLSLCAIFQHIPPLTCLVFKRSHRLSETPQLVENIQRQLL